MLYQSLLKINEDCTAVNSSSDTAEERLGHPSSFPLISLHKFQLLLIPITPILSFSESFSLVLSLGRLSRK